MVNQNILKKYSKSKETLKSFNEWIKNQFVQEAFAEAFSGKY